MSRVSASSSSGSESKRIVAPARTWEAATKGTGGLLRRAGAAQEGRDEGGRSKGGSNLCGAALDPDGAEGEPSVEGPVEPHHTDRAAVPAPPRRALG